METSLIDLKFLIIGIITSGLAYHTNRYKRGFYVPDIEGNNGATVQSEEHLSMRIILCSTKDNQDACGLYSFVSICRAPHWPHAKTHSSLCKNMVSD